MALAVVVRGSGERGRGRGEVRCARRGSPDPACARRGSPDPAAVRDRRSPRIVGDLRSSKCGVNAPAVSRPRSRTARESPATTAIAPRHEFATDSSPPRVRWHRTSRQSVDWTLGARRTGDTMLPARHHRPLASSHGRLKPPEIVPRRLRR